MKYRTFALMLLVWLVACGPVVSNNALTAPNVRQYPISVQHVAEKEVRSGVCPILTEMVIDYCVMRDQSRVLSGKKPTCVHKN